MDIQLLKTVLAVCEEGSFSGAAIKLNSAQSNITTRIRKLEVHYKQPIFTRGKAGAQLTEFGKVFKEQAEALLRQFEMADDFLMDAGGNFAALKLGAMETIVTAHMPNILRQLRLTCPDALISLYPGTSDELMRLVWDRKIHAAFVAGIVDEDRFKGISAFHEKLVWVQSKEQGNTKSLLAFREGCCYRKRAESYLQDIGTSDLEIIQLGSMDAILSCVRMGMGFAIAPESSVKSSGDLKITPLPENYSEIEISLIWRRDHYRSKAHNILSNIVSK